MLNIVRFQRFIEYDGYTDYEDEARKKELKKMVASTPQVLLTTLEPLLDRFAVTQLTLVNVSLHCFCACFSGDNKSFQMLGDEKNDVVSSIASIIKTYFSLADKNWSVIHSDIGEVDKCYQDAKIDDS